MNILIDAKEQNYSIIEGEYFPLSFGMMMHETHETWKYNPFDEKNLFCFGRGILPVIGGHRLIFSFRSPLWDGFHFSAMGGAGYTFKDTGVSNVAITGKCSIPSLIVINGEEENLKVDFIPFNDKIESIYEFNEKIIDKFKEKNYRAFLVGPASKTTNMGAIYSHTIKNGKAVEGSEDWAARGGGGSVLFQAHNIVGVVFFGKKRPEKDLRHIVEEHFKKPYTKVVLENTEKYRYSEEKKTGGTFGNNYHITMELTPIFNWRMPFIDKNKRFKLHRKILKHFVKNFDIEAIETKNWTNCGEPCPTVCKKHRNGLHVDYEPYEANGPLLGIFDIYAADKVVNMVDTIGIDAIEFGNLCSWVFELLDNGMLKPEEVGIEKPVFDIESFENDEDILKNSEHNAKQAVAFAKIVAFNENEFGNLCSRGVRRASKVLNEKYPERIKDRKFEDFGVYDSFGKEGQISPTMYWAIGNFMPYLIQGKYLTHYQCGVFLEPEELAKLSVKNTLEEIMLENLGICRFHRKWITPIIDKLLKEVSDIDIFFESKKLLKDISKYDSNIGYPTMESKRVEELIISGANEFENEKWSKEFEKGNFNEYIKRVVKKYEELLEIDWKIK
ncbi:Aldehyde ferredoxin oxidoreductase [Methanococcus vannielii SB]|uniref:Aldehyde ferredoxin oxidoreductase n=1 Tax=Methanococcus vannielii (strain ATCC 35089 / DSM 1224 / JCM 13029 / OCM 148 / SB) TaxID=406327 RepID=A6UNT1_METVS|nr:aldehyde ferredoxin oxidoreductase N-terminal domain-containing protein [Methanococcus vannielii]ABR54153.1 Aldehyde ferredoxin oxidoreductase [Methanococcus vannielii SB]